MFKQFSSYWKKQDIDDASKIDDSAQNQESKISVPPAKDPSLPHDAQVTWMVQCEESKGKWKPFRKVDCFALEEAFNQAESRRPVLVEGGRQQVDLEKRTLNCVYWPAPPLKVVRARWFWRHRTSTGPYPWAPFVERDQDELEAFYMRLHLNNYRSRREQFPSLKLSTGHSIFATRLVKSELKDPSSHLFDVVFCDPNLYEKQYLGIEEPFVWELFQAHPQTLRSARLPVQWGQERRRSRKPKLGRLTKDKEYRALQLSRQRPLRRGYGDYFAEDEDELNRPVRHLIFAVHGVGEALWSQGKLATAGVPSLRNSIRPFRSMVLQHADELAERHRQDNKENENPKGRIEILPVEWYDAVHSAELQLSQALRRITLPSIPFFREVANDVALDALLYMSPDFHQRITNTVADRLNTVYQQFLSNNPSFQGSISIIGYSLGSIITYDLLAHQEPFSNYDPAEPHLSLPRSPVKCKSNEIEYKCLEFPVQNFFMIGSPVGLFLTIRGEMPSADFSFPTVLGSVCNIFHPYDPVAYRIEPLIQPKLEYLDPQYIPHCSAGGMRLHLKIKDLAKNVHTSSQDLMSRIASFGEILRAQESGSSESLMTSGADSLDSSFTSANTLQSTSSLSKEDLESSSFVYEREESMRDNSPTLSRQGSFSSIGSFSSVASTLSNYWEDGPKRKTDPVNRDQDQSEVLERLLNLVAMNSGNRIDFCLQENVIELQNEYISSFSSHTSYFCNEDLALFIASILIMHENPEFDIYRNMQLAKNTPARRGAHKAEIRQKPVEQKRNASFGNLMLSPIKSG